MKLEFRLERLLGTVFFIPLLPAPAEFLTISAHTYRVCVTHLQKSEILLPHSNRDVLILCLLPSCRRKKQKICLNSTKNALYLSTAVVMLHSCYNDCFRQKCHQELPQIVLKACLIPQCFIKTLVPTHSKVQTIIII